MTRRGGCAVGLTLAFLLGAAGQVSPQTRPAPPAQRSQPAKPSTGAAKAPLAVKKDSRSPITIDADRMEAMRKENLVIFTGNVVVKQDSSTQYADRMEVYLDDQGEKISRINSVGNVKIITEDCRTGTANRAEYYDDEQKVVLIENAKVWEDENVVTGDRITIFLAEDRSIVEAKSQGRVKGVFYPKKEGEGASASTTGTARRGAPCR